MTVVVRHNLPDFKQQLKRVKTEFQVKTVKESARASGRVFRNEAVRIAPELDRNISGRKFFRVKGALKRAISVFQSRIKKPQTYRLVVMPRTTGKIKRGLNVGRVRRIDPFYWYFLEGGWIPRKPGDRLRGGARSRALHRRRNSGKKITEYAFLVPAFKAVQNESLRAFGLQLDRSLKRLEKIK